MEQTQELLQKWDARARRLHTRMEITGEGLTLGAGTVLAKVARDGRGHPCLALDDEPRVMALLAAAYEQPVEVHVLAKLRRAATLWNDGEKALAHIHLAHTGLPPCDDDQVLRLFLAEECLAAGVTPAELMKAQGFVPALLALLKYDPEQPRVPAGSGRESGQWTSDGNTSGAQPPPTATPPTSNNVQVAQNNIKCSAFIAEKCKGSIMREFPSEYLDLSIDQLLKDAQAGVQAFENKCLTNKRSMYKCHLQFSILSRL